MTAEITVASRTTSLIQSVERASRTSAVLMALGALLVGFSLWYATFRLNAVQSQVSTLERRAENLTAKNRQLETHANDLTRITKSLNDQVAGLRQALSASRDAIAAFHDRDYTTAVHLYDTALAADPGNAYIMNLKAYSLFKLGRVADAIEVQTHGIETDSNYAWGYFDLARFQCATGDKSAAARSLATAITKEDRFRQLSTQDGEFQRLCGRLSR